MITTLPVTQQDQSKTTTFDESISALQPWSTPHLIRISGDSTLKEGGHGETGHWSTDPSWGVAGPS